MEPCDIQLVDKFKTVHDSIWNDRLLSYNEELLRCENEAMAEFIRRNGMWNAYQAFLKNAKKIAGNYEPWADSYKASACISAADYCAKERSCGHPFLLNKEQLEKREEGWYEKGTGYWHPYGNPVTGISKYDQWAQNP